MSNHTFGKAWGWRENLRMALALGVMLVFGFLPQISGCASHAPPKSRLDYLVQDLHKYGDPASISVFQEGDTLMIYVILHEGQGSDPLWLEVK